MQDIIALFLILSITYFIFFSSFENFKVVGYNNPEVPSYDIPSVFETETNELNELFLKLSKDSDFNTSQYKLQNTYLPFPFNNPLKKYIVDYLKMNVAKYKKDKLEIMSDINNIYWMDNGNDRLFVFNINLVNNTKFMTRNVQVKLRVKDIQKFIKNDSDYSTGEEIQDKLTNYRTNIPEATMINSFELSGIRLGTNNFSHFSLKGLDKLDYPYYQIKNILYLMDPFLTSGKDMTITLDMKKNFEKEIKAHQELLDVLSGKKKA